MSEPVNLSHWQTAVELLTVGEAAAMCGVSARHLRRLADSGDFPQPVKLGRAVRFRRAELLAWIASGAQSPRRSGWIWASQSEAKS